MRFMWAFVIGGLICTAGQLLLDLTAATPSRILTGYVTTGVVLSALGIYSPLAHLAGAGATVPLLGFGHALAQGVRQAVDDRGLTGVLTGGLSSAAGGLTVCMLCGLVASFVCRSHDLS